MAKNGKQETTALALATHDKFALSQLGGVEALPAILRDNCGPEGMDALDLERVPVPGSGGLQWTVKDLEGETMVEHIDGVIIGWDTVRLYWRLGYDEGGAGQPPDCVSTDAVHGVGDIGDGETHRDCATCPMAQFGTAGGGKKRGQACRLVRRMFVMRECDILPIVIGIPPSSLKANREYMMRLSRVARPYHSVITRFALERTKSADDITYSKVAHSVAAKLDDKAAEYFKGVRDAYAKVLGNVVIDGSEYAGAD